MQDPDATVIRPRGRAAAPADPDATVIRPRREPPVSDPDATVVRPVGVPAPTPPHPTRPLPKSAPLALPVGFRLHEYRIDGVLGQGGFGITYLATDVNLHARVAIKEYLPEEIAFRAGDRSVSPNASRHRDRYRSGMDSFLAEARTLASFRHRSLVRVARFFEAHRTAYMVLEYEKGSPLKTWWPAHAGLGEKGLVELLLPLLDGLEVVHAAGVLHRDIKPDNIQVRAEDGRLVLLDFGSSGQVVAVADQAAVVVTPGYAPIEQYGLGQQGPWTDVYALAATLYWCVSGRKPPDAELRSVDPSSLLPALQAGQGRFGGAFLNAIDAGLATDPARRPRSIGEFRRALLADHPASLNLIDALRKGDTVIEGEGDGEGPAPRQEPLRVRLRRGLRQLPSPAQWPLAAKMTLAMLATALLPMAATGWYNLQGSQAAVSESELRFVEQLAHSTAGRVSQFITDHRHQARALATEPQLAAVLVHPDEAGQAALRERLAAQVQADPDVQLLLLLDRSGNAIVSTDPEVSGRNFAFRQYFQEAMQGHDHVTGLVVGAVAGASGMVFAEPIADAGGRPLGVLALRVRGSSVAAIVDEVRNDASLTPFLIDGDGVVIHHLQPELLYHSLMPLSAAQRAAIRADQRFRRDSIESLDLPVLAAAMVGAQQTGHVVYPSRRGGPLEIAGYAPVTALDWVVGVSEPRSSFVQPLLRLQRELLWSVLLVGLLGTGLALRFARGIVRPIRQLTEAASALKAGDFEHAAVSVKRRDEIGQLARTFSVMVDVLRQRERERERAAPGAPPPPGPGPG